MRWDKPEEGERKREGEYACSTGVQGETFSLVVGPGVTVGRMIA
jgi:hypothetical protein